MGHLDIFAKNTFEDETSTVTGGAVKWEEVKETKLKSVHIDGVLHVVNPANIASLDAPWCFAGDDEVVVEVKMQGDKTDRPVMDRGLLRRQGRQVKRREEPKNTWKGQQMLWFVSAFRPRWLSEDYTVTKVADGCYKLEPGIFSLYWIVSNELPLKESLIPFLISRRKAKLLEFVYWVADKRPMEWIEHMVEVLPMSEAQIKAFQKHVPDTDDPERLKRREWFTEMLLEKVPEVREKIEQTSEKKGRLEELQTFYCLRLGRDLTATEQAILTKRLEALGVERMRQVVLELSTDALADWLAAEEAT